MLKDKLPGTQIILLGFLLEFEALLNVQVLVNCCNTVLGGNGHSLATKCAFLFVLEELTIPKPPRSGLPLLFSVVLCSCQAETYMVVTRYNLVSPNWFTLENKAWGSSVEKYMLSVKWCLCVKQYTSTV